jgi:hypothetical protein
VNLADFDALSFDCYGTLVDWETGIAAVLVAWAKEAGLDLADEELLVAYAENEAQAERDALGALYPAVLAEAFRRTGNKLGRPVSDGRNVWATRSPTGRHSTTRPKRSPPWPETTNSSSCPMFTVRASQGRTSVWA